jgi:hypothetical protein
MSLFVRTVADRSRPPLQGLPIPPSPEQPRRQGPERVVHDVQVVGDEAGVDGRQEDLENPRPRHQRDDQLGRAGRLVVPQPEAPLGEEHDRDPEGDADQVVEVFVGEASRPDGFQDQPVDRIRRQADQEQRVAEVAEAHGSVTPRDDM